MDMKVKLIFDGDIEVLRKYEDMMWKYDERYNIKVDYIMEYDSELIGILREFKRMVELGMDGDRLVGIMFYLLGGVMTEEMMENFRYFGLSGLVEELFGVIEW